MDKDAVGVGARKLERVAGKLKLTAAADAELMRVGERDVQSTLVTRQTHVASVKNVRSALGSRL